MDRPEMVRTTGTLLQEIGCKDFTRNDIAKTYWFALRSSWPTDWERVNRAIIARWSFYALTYIKERAHSGKCWEPGVVPSREEG